ncbi:hypothetical protein V5799_010575 [Amblyomma americanum]|uniref:Major facilitator superfamily (MFS) profile domain-containing protein n=1 Tax=Amblyomma americanum TaxID=6943 RepID=A0AAQ4EJM9_AMBAM
MEHWCRRPDSFANLSVADWKQLAIPLDERGRFSRCTMRDPPDASYAPKVVPCTSWEFDMDKYGNNIVSQWNLVCDRRWLIDVARLVYSATCIISLPVSGVFADRVGRKTVIFITVPVVLIAGVGSSVPNDFQFFVAVRAIVSAATSALVPPTYAVLIEVTPATKIAAYITVGALLSFVMVPPTLLAAQIFKAGWAALQLLLMVPTCLLVFLYYGIEESPAWLLATGKAKEAERVSLRAARLNRVSPQLCRELLAQYQLEVGFNNHNAAEQSGLCGSHLRTRTALLSFMWTALSFAYDTFVSNDGVLVSDGVTAVGYTLSAVACLLGVPYVERFGFKNIVVVSGVTFSATSAVLAITYSQDETWLRDCLVVLMRTAGNVCISFFICQTVGAYPEVTHCRALALCFAFSRLGATLGQTSTALLGDLHTDLRLAGAAALMSLFAVAAQVLPYEHDWVPQGRPKCGGRSNVASGDDMKRAMRDTLMPLPKEPIKRRSSRSSGRISVGPEQYSTHSVQRSRSISLG